MSPSLRAAKTKMTAIADSAAQLLPRMPSIDEHRASKKMAARAGEAFLA
jgi:hypothetical protein